MCLLHKRYFLLGDSMKNAHKRKMKKVMEEWKMDEWWNQGRYMNTNDVHTNNDGQKTDERQMDNWQKTDNKWSKASRWTNNGQMNEYTLSKIVSNLLFYKEYLNNIFFL